MSEFEDHCWKDVVPGEILHLYRHYEREVGVGPRPALLLIDLYRMVYAGGARPATEVAEEYPSACGSAAWDAIEPTCRLIAAARQKRLPILYTTGMPDTVSSSGSVRATKRKGRPPQASDFEIKEEFAPQPSDVVIEKQRASAFFGTLLTVHLTRLGIQSLIVAGESTSGCVRASVVDAYSHGYNVAIVEECCFDRSELSHKIGLFDMHHKYGDVLRVSEVLDHLAAYEESA